MATYQIFRWQEIPSVVEARDESSTKKQQLSDRFQALIDHAAMLRNLAGSDDYMDHWNRSAPETRPGSAAEVLAKVVAEVEDRFALFREDVNKSRLS
jgi:hypothetical protein